MLTSRSLSAGAGCGTDAELALTQDRVDPGDVATHGLQASVALELPGRRLEAQVEQLFLRLLELGDERVVVKTVQLDRSELLRPDSHQMPPPSRTTNRHFIGSLCIARR